MTKDNVCFYIYWICSKAILILAITGLANVFQICSARKNVPLSWMALKRVISPIPVYCHVSWQPPHSIPSNLWLILHWGAEFSGLHAFFTLFLTVIASLPTSLKLLPGIMRLCEWPNKRPMSTDDKSRHLHVRWMPLRERWVCIFQLLRAAKRCRPCFIKLKLERHKMVWWVRRPGGKK